MKKKQRMWLWTVAPSVCMAVGMTQPTMTGVAKKSAVQTSGNAANNMVEAAAVQIDLYFVGQEMYTYQRLGAGVQLLKSEYEGVTADPIRKTVDGRNICHIVTDNPNAEEKVLMLVTTHAREYITTLLVMRQMREILDRRASEETALNDVCIQFVPVANPDDVQISQRTLDGLNNANSKQTVQRVIESWMDWGLLEDEGKYNWYLSKWKNNANDVDLNHNFPTKGWAQSNDNRGKALPEFCKGLLVASEPETQAVIKLVNEQKFNEVINHRVQGQTIYWLQMHTSKEAQAKDEVMMVTAARRTDYALVDSTADGSRYGAGFRDWLDWERDIPNITLEVGPGVSSVPGNQIEKVWQQNQNLFPELVNTLLGRNSESISNDASTTTAGDTAQGSGVHYVSPKGSGDVNKSLAPPGTE